METERFLDEDYDNSRFFAGGQGDRAQFDLPGYCLFRLRAAGVGAAGWTTIKLPANKARPRGLFERWIEESYRLQAPKKLVSLLDS